MERGRFEARVELVGFPARPAVFEATRRGAVDRGARALLVLAVFWMAGPALYLVPPHVIWVVVAVKAGVVFAIHEWRGEYRVHRFEGACPRCGSALSVKTGVCGRFPRALSCFTCHHSPVLVVGEQVVDRDAGELQVSAGTQ